MTQVSGSTRNPRLTVRSPPKNQRYAITVRGSGWPSVCPKTQSAQRNDRRTEPQPRRWAISSRNTTMMIASPTAASPAAMAITNRDMIWPASESRWWANATRLRLAPFSMISTHMSTMMKFRRTSTPTSPVTNRIALTATYAPMGTIVIPLTIHAPDCGRGRGFRQDDGSDDGAQQEHADDLERQEVVAEH